MDRGINGSMDWTPGMMIEDHCLLHVAPDVERLEMPRSVNALAPDAFEESTSLKYIVAPGLSPLAFPTDELRLKAVLGFLADPDRFDTDTVPAYLDAAVQLQTPALEAALADDLSFVTRFYAEQGIINAENIDRLIDKSGDLDALSCMEYLIRYKEKHFYHPRRKRKKLWEYLFRSVSTPFKRGDWSHQLLPDNSYILTSYNGEDEHIHIPSFIGKYEVTALANHVFSEHTMKSARSIHIPETIHHIRPRSFAKVGLWQKEELRRDGLLIIDGCLLEIPPDAVEVRVPDDVHLIAEGVFTGHADLRVVTIPKGVEYLGDGQFRDCTSLTRVDLPATITHIGARCFQNCSALTSISLPGDIERVGAFAFRDCRSLTTIALPPQLDGLEEALFKGCTSLHEASLPPRLRFAEREVFSGCTALTTIHLPDTVSRLAERVFEDCTALQEIDLPGSLRQLSAGLFLGCHRLVRVGLPLGLRSIGERSLQGCRSLESIRLPEGLARIGRNAFADTGLIYRDELWKDGLLILNDYLIDARSSIQRATVPANVAMIADGAFANCSSMEEVSIQAPLSFIGQTVFDCCTALTRVGIPASVTEIHSLAFRACRSLRQLTLPAGLVKLGWGALSGCTALEWIDLPVGVRRIEPRVFEGCTSLSVVYLSPETETIGSRAFSSCKNLTSLDLPGTVLKIQSDAFEGCERLHIMAPYGSSPYIFATRHGLGVKDGGL